MAKKKKKNPAEDVNPRLDPETRLVHRFDSAGVALFPVASPEEMGFRVLDDSVEERQL